MGERFTGWYRYAGDVNASPALRDLAKKLLGDLANQQKLGAPPTLVLRKETKDGFVEAAFIDGMPRVRIIPRRGGPPPEAPLPLIEGFVVRPAPATNQYTNTDLNQVVLSPPRKDERFKQTRWVARFYDGDAVPDGYTLPAGLYGVDRNGQELFPDGLVDWGHIDWRNKDQTVVVHFHGPETRYFGHPTNQYNDYSSGVFYKGKWLLDLDAIDTDDVDLVGGAVRGACLVKEDGDLNLLVVARYPSGFGNGDHEQELLLRIAVHPTDEAKHRARPGSKWYELPELQVEIITKPDETQAVPAEVVAQWTLDWDLYGSHPWCFNQSGTEARCIRYYDDAKLVIEGVLTVTPEPGGDHYVENTLSSSVPTVNQVVTTALTAQPNPIVREALATQKWQFTSSGPTWSFSGMVADDPANTTYETTVNNGGDQVIAYEGTETWTPSQEWVVCAVDYRDDVPVYAELRIPEYTGLTTLSRDIDATITDFNDNYSVPTQLDSAPTFEASVDNNTDVDVSATLTYSKRETWGAQALRTDWLTHEATPRTSTQTLTETGSEASSYTDTITGVLALTTPSGGVRYGLPFFSISSEVKTASGTTSHSIEWYDVDHLRDMYVWYLDLRYKLLAVAESQVDTEHTISTSKSTSITTADQFSYIGVNTPFSPLSPPIPIVDTTLADLAVTRGAHVDLKVGVEGHPLDKTVMRDTVQTGTITGLTKWFDGAYALSRAAGSCFFSTNPRGAQGVTQIMEYAATPPSMGITDGSTYTAGGTVSGDLADYLINVVPFDIRQSETPATNTATDDYRLAHTLHRSSGWQAYRGHFCYSVAMPWWDNAERTYEFGLGSLSTGEQYEDARRTIPVLTGATEDEVRFHPVWVLPPTLPR